MRAVTVTHMWCGFPQVKVFSWEYTSLTDERMLRKVKGWCKSNIVKQYEAGEVVITFYDDIMDITTAINVPLT